MNRYPTQFNRQIRPKRLALRYIDTDALPLPAWLPPALKIWLYFPQDDWISVSAKNYASWGLMGSFLNTDHSFLWLCYNSIWRASSDGIFDSRACSEWKSWNIALFPGWFIYQFPLRTTHCEAGQFFLGYRSQSLVAPGDYTWRASERGPEVLAAKCLGGNRICISQVYP